MADSPSFTNYQLISTTLELMKEASGNYMPDYGSWRALIGPEEEEDDDKHYFDPEAEVNVDITEGDPGSGHWEKEEYEETTDLDTYGKAYADDPSLADKYGSQENFEKAAEEWWADEAAKKGISIDELKNSYKQVKKGERWVWVQDTEATEGSYTVSATATSGDKTAYESQSGLLKRSPYKQVNEPYVPQTVGPGGYQPDYGRAELEAARQAVKDRNSISSTHYYDQGKEMITDLKNNLFNVGVVPEEIKDNKRKAFQTMGTISSSLQALLGKDGVLKDTIEILDKGLMSGMFMHAKPLAKVLKGDPDVRLGLTPENNVIFQVPTGDINPDTGEPVYMALSRSTIDDMNRKAVIQYGFGDRINKGIQGLAIAGRNGEPFDEDKIRVATRQDLVKMGPEGLASVLGDPGIVTDRPLIDLSLEGMEADSESAFTMKAQDVDSKNLIFQTLSTPEGEEEAMEMVIDAVVHKARNTHGINYAQFQENNKPQNPTADMSVEQKVQFYKRRFV